MIKWLLDFVDELKHPYKYLHKVENGYLYRCSNCGKERVFRNIT